MSLHLRKASIVSLAIVLSCSYCHPRSTHPSPEDRSFYCWKSVFSLTGKERKYLQLLRIHQLYVRFFDVTWDAQRGRAMPTAPVRFHDSSYQSYRIIPVVFIANEVLANLDTAAEVQVLANNIAHLTTQLRENNRIPPPTELQLDCDWTATTRDRYFALLKRIRQWMDAHGQKPTQLSATIRLYQCKYRDLTGVPPVDKGLLMCYNMGDLKNTMAHNSILETAELEKYTSHLPSYPLPLDVALPIFNWKVYFHEGRYAGLVESLPTTLLDNAAVTRSGNFYTFKRDTSLSGYSFEKGDQLRDEQSDYAALQAAAQVVARQLKRPPGAVLFFQLDSTNLANYTTDDLENIYSDFN